MNHWLAAWADLAEALVVILTAARVRPNWGTELRWFFFYEALKKTAEEPEEPALGV
jgi:hypothetical protein